MKELVDVFFYDWKNVRVKMNLYYSIYFNSFCIKELIVENYIF